MLKNIKELIYIVMKAFKQYFKNKKILRCRTKNTKRLTHTKNLMIREEKTSMKTFLYP